MEFWYSVSCPPSEEIYNPRYYVQKFHTLFTKGHEIKRYGWKDLEKNSKWTLSLDYRTTKPKKFKT